MSPFGFTPRNTQPSRSPSESGLAKVEARTRMTVRVSKGNGEESCVK